MLLNEENFKKKKEITECVGDYYKLENTCPQINSDQIRLGKNRSIFNSISTFLTEANNLEF
jgi:hypothetical protein